VDDDMPSREQIKKKVRCVGVTVLSLPFPFLFFFPFFLFFFLCFLCFVSLSFLFFSYSYSDRNVIYRSGFFLFVEYNGGAWVAVGIVDRSTRWATMRRMAKWIAPIARM
jgi:hypothetical protein